MEAKEKAEELFNKYKPICAGYNGGQSNKYFSKQAALIAVDEILECYPAQCPKESYEMEQHIYWQQVKTEINKI
jgi:hypothetical protein